MYVDASVLRATRQDCFSRRRSSLGQLMIPWKGGIYSGKATTRRNGEGWRGMGNANA
jgi:hypothetical protein